MGTGLLLDRITPDAQQGALAGAPTMSSLVTLLPQHSGWLSLVLPARVHLALALWLDHVVIWGP